MKVILFQDIPTLGRKYDIKIVKPGYARNFLIPRGLAKPASESAIKNLAQAKVKEEQRIIQELENYKAVVEKLKDLTLTFKVKVGESGRAFGSVSAVKIRDELKKHKIEVEKECILLENPIKTTGESKVKIKFPQEIVGEVKVAVEAE